MNERKLDEIAKAIFIVNRHAKTAPQPQHLYHIKKEAINLLLEKNHAKKIGLHFSSHPKFSNQHSTLLVQVGHYFFHIPPIKSDFQELRHLGETDSDYRNPTTKMSLSHAKKIIYRYIDWEPKKQSKPANKQYASSYYTPSSLGKMDWPRRKSPRR